MRVLGFFFGMSLMKKVAILIDAGFFIKKIQHYYRKHFSSQDLTSKVIIDIMWGLVNYHTNIKNDLERERRLELYRIYFYDCPPLDKQIKFPLPCGDHKTPSDKNFKKDPNYILSTSLHKDLKQCRKVALRMGTLSGYGEWQINTNTLKNLLKKEREWENLTNDDFHYAYSQKQVDIKLGMDITTLAYEKLVESIVLVAGDSDFVPAAKLARTKGIDFILDPLKHDISDSLNEHIDGVQSFNITACLARLFSCDPNPKPAWWDEMIVKRQKKKQRKKQNNKNGHQNSRKSK